MISFKAPKTKYASVRDIGKFNMMWDVSFILVPIFFALFLMHAFFGDLTWLTSLAACLVALFNVIVLYFTRKYMFITILSIIAGVAMCQVVIFGVSDSQLISNVMWCVLISLFAFFMLNSLIGTLVLLANLTGMVIYFGSISPDQIQPQFVDHKMIIDVYYVALAMAFVVYKIMLNNREINKRYEQEIAHNEILLKEIHHRVKNNLQIISSLLKLQSAESGDKRVEEHFDEAINRIRSMALIHEKMYNNSDLSRIDIKSYIIALVEDLISTFHSDCNIEFNVVSDVERIDIKSIVPISLIFNELITNTLKHGFKNEKNGIIEVNISDEGKRLNFQYKDNGKWKEPLGKATFGMELMKTLCDQLEGECSREIENGTKYQFKFNSELFFFKEPE